MHSELQNWINTLQKCRHEKKIEDAKRLYDYILEQGLESHPILGNYLVPMLVECGSLQDAEQAFDSLAFHDRNHYSLNSLISGFIGHGEPQHALHLYRKLQDGGKSCMQPTTTTYLSLLSACARLKDTETGRNLHVELVQRGLEKCVFMDTAVVGNTLVDMYCKCGLLAEAHQVFERLPIQDAVSWNALIAGYAAHGLSVEAGNCFRQMQLEGITPALVTFICTLKACATMQALEMGQEIHSETVKRGLETEIYVGNTLVNMYMACGLIVEAYLVFERLLVRDAISWNALFAGYAEHGLGKEAEIAFQQMLSEGMSPDFATFVSCLKACCSTRALEIGQGVHAETIKRALERDLHVGSTLIAMYIECGSYAEACHVFEGLPLKDAVSWAALIAGYCEHGLQEEVASCLQQMLLDGISPDCVMFVCILKACATMKALDMGRKMHAEVAKLGLETEPRVGSILVDMYAECGLMFEAHQLFDRLPARSTVSWNALIAGYAEYGLGEEARNCFREMLLDGLSPDVVTFVCSLKACVAIQALETGQVIHTETIKAGFEMELTVGSTLVAMYSECGLLAEAQQLLDGLPDRDTASWNAMIAGYVEHGLHEEAADSLQKMAMEGVSPDLITFVCSLRACSTARALDRGLELHVETVKRGVDRDLYITSSLVDMYAECESILEARIVFDRLPGRDAFVYNSLIAGYIEQGQHEEVENYIDKMQVEGIAPDSVTFKCSLKACSSVGALETGRIVHTEIMKTGFDKECHLGSKLVAMYSDCGSLQEARYVSDRLPGRNTDSWNALILGYNEQGLSEEAVECFQQMLMEDIWPDSVSFIQFLKAVGATKASEIGQATHVELTKQGFEQELHVGSALVSMYFECDLLSEACQVFDCLPGQYSAPWNALITGYLEHGLGEEAAKCCQHMLLEGICPDCVTFVCTLKACGSIRAMETGQTTHAEIAKRGLDRVDAIGNMLVDMYGKCGSLAEAQQVFQGLQAQDEVSWAALSAAYTELGCDEKAASFFQQMQEKGLSPDSVTFVCSLKACGIVGAVEMSRIIHSEVTKRGSEMEICLGNTLVDVYGKFGLLAEARQVFDKLPVRSVISWTAMIKAYGKNHEGSLAVDCFQDMQKQGMNPSPNTLICLFAACSHSSLVIEGCKYFWAMRDLGMELTSDHCACLVDLLARSGHIHKAEKFLTAMRCPPSSVVLFTLLSACKIYGEVELGQRCFQQLVEVNQEDSSAYSLMADIYASVGKWSDANSLQKMRNHAGAKKMPGMSVIEVKERLHEFVVGHSHNKDIPEMSEVLSLQIKAGGYIPDLDMISRYACGELNRAATCVSL